MGPIPSGFRYTKLFAEIQSEDHPRALMIGRRSVAAAMALLLPGLASATEGMWRPDQVPELSSEFTAMGAQIAPSALSTPGQGPLGAIVGLGGCSGAFVSPEGLVATAFHCIWDGLQHASHEGENLVENGYNAGTKDQERWGGPQLELALPVEMRNVTEDVLSGTRKLDGDARGDRRDGNIRSLIKRCESDVGVRCEVVPYDQGNEFWLIKRMEFKDVRLVYSPPRNVGYFGGDADNWQWPRHSGDFAFIRVYAAPDGTPAQYSPNNVPYKPKNFLKPAMGPQSGEFVAVAGFPDSTFRWLTAAEIETAANEQYPRELETFNAVLDIFHDFAEDHPDQKGKVQPRILSINNQKQYTEGQLVAFRRLQATDRKWQFEKDLAQWIVANESRQKRYGNLLDQIHSLQAEAEATAVRDHIAENLVKNTVMLQTASKLYRLAKEGRKGDGDRSAGFKNSDRPELREWLDGIDARYDWRVDMAVAKLFLMRALTLPEGLRIPELDAWFKALPHKGTVEQRVDAELERLYVKNIDLTNPDKRRALMDTSAWFLETSGNPWFTLAARLQPFYERLEDVKKARKNQWEALRPLYLQAVKEFVPEARPRVSSEGKLAPGLFYPDANQTLRVTIGKVDGYFPRDGLIASPKTWLSGLAEKAGEAPYDTEPLLLTAISQGKWGPYGDSRMNSVAVNYLSTADTTLGSSGSATLNAKGEWCGVLFDGNYESMATDWLFEERLTRSIHTDSSFVLWYLDAVAGADGLVTELGFTPALETVQPATETSQR